jgi:glycosyltransferase involved in cell wall biosynthesis
MPNTGLPAGKPVFGMVGTVEERKNVAAVVDAVGRLRASGSDLYLAVIGRAESEYALALRGRVAENALLRDRVLFVGEVDDVPSALAALDCLVMASRWEGFPRGLLEGICMGVPVIATDVGEVAAMLDHHSGGRIIPVDDGEALAAAMTDVLAHPHVARALAWQTATRARERYSQAAHVTRMSALLEDVARRASSE